MVDRPDAEGQVSIDRADDEFIEADEALDRGDGAAAASLIDRRVERRALGGSNATNSEPHPGFDPFAIKLAAAEDLLRHERRERLVVLDRTGRVTLYLRGNASQVALPIDRDGRTDTSILNQLENAQCLTHNHPIDAGRPIGGTMSLSDILLAQRFEVRQLRVAAPEATYSLQPKVDMKWDASWATSTKRAYRQHQASLDRAMAAAAGTPDRDIYFYLRVFDFLMVQLAKGLGLTYERIDRPRDEWAMAVPGAPVAIGKPGSPIVIDDSEHFEWVSSFFDIRDL